MDLLCPTGQLIRDVRRTKQQERKLSRRKSILVTSSAVALFVMGAPVVRAQSAPPPAQDGLLRSGPPTWAANRDGVITCDEWKSFADRIFTLADRNRDGRLDKAEFATVQKADAALTDADFGYFDENQDGKVTRSEFVDKPSASIVRFDRNGDCRVTADELRAATAPKGSQGPVERPRDRFH